MCTRARWLLVAVVALVLPVQGCGTGDKGMGPPPDLNSRIQGAITLEGFVGCADLETYAKDLTKQQIELQYDAWAEGGCWGCGYGWATPAEAPVDTNGASGGAAGEPGGQGGQGGSDKGEAGVDYSTTNVQEEGVDEADFVKTDGEWLYLLRGGSLLIVDPMPAAGMAVVSETPIAGRPLEMFVDGDRAAVFSAHWGFDVAQAAQPEDDGPKAWNDRLRLTVVDVSDRAAPLVLREVLFEGTYVSSRLTGGAVHAVVRTNVALASSGVATGGAGGGTSGGTGGVVSVDAGSATPVEPAAAAEVDPTQPGEPGEPGEPIDPGGDPGGDPGADAGPTWQEQLETARAEALAKVDALTLEDLVPLKWEVTRDDAGAEVIGAPEPITGCGDFWRPTLAYGPSTVSVVTLRLDAPADEGVVTVFGNGDTVYASPGRLYLAADIYNGWYGWFADAQEDWQHTAIHAFDLAFAVDRATYLGSGKVEGRVLDQFSLSEHMGDLRVATTKDLWTQGPDASESMVTVLGLEAGELVEKGKVAGLGKGERIYAARFFGDRGFVVTFRQVDPLYTVDLTDPTAPVVAGELKIPGFSTYIHPLGEDHLLTIGRDTLDNGQWVQVGGVQLTIFDVSDMAAPVQAHKVVLGEAGTQSEALYEHKAFTYLASRGLLVIPLSTWGGSSVEPGGGGGGTVEPGAAKADDATPPDAAAGVEPGDVGPVVQEPIGVDAEEPEPSWFTGAAVFDVSPAEGFHERGLIDHTDLAPSGAWWGEAVSRAVIIGDYVYTIGTLGMKASWLADLTEVSHVLFPVDEGSGGPKPLPAEGGASPGAAD